MKKRVIILGAGPAGLTIGYEILKNDNNVDVIILEKDDMVGVISKTKEFNNNRFDLGGDRYFTQNENFLNWWGNFLVFENKSENINNDYMLIKNRKSSILYNGKYIDYPITFSTKTISALGFLDSIKVVLSYIYARISSFQIKSLADFYRKNFGAKLYKLFFKDYTEKLWGKDAKYISSECGKQRVRGFSITEIIKSWYSNKYLSSNRTTQPFFYYPVCGSGQLWDNVANEFCNLGGKIIFNADVYRLSCCNNQVKDVECIDEKNRKSLSSILGWIL